MEGVKQQRAREGKRAGIFIPDSSVGTSLKLKSEQCSTILASGTNTKLICCSMSDGLVGLLC